MEEFVAETIGEVPKKSWGGRRRGAGRKRLPGRRKEAHVARAPHPGGPLLVSVLVRSRGVPLLAGESVRACIAVQIGKATKPSFVVHHVEVLPDRVMMVVDAANQMALSRGMQGLGVRTARQINRLTGHRGSLFDDRYSTRQLRNGTELDRAREFLRLAQETGAFAWMLAPDGVDDRETGDDDEEALEDEAADV